MGQFLLIGVIGLAIFLFGWLQVRKSNASAAWPTVPGVIAGASIRQDESGDDEGASLGIHLDYRFQVGGRNYAGNRIRFDETRYDTTKKAQTELAKYPVGMQVQVYYDPQNPANCVLQRSNRTGWGLLVIGAVITLAAIAAMLK